MCGDFLNWQKVYRSVSHLMTACSSHCRCFIKGRGVIQRKNPQFPRLNLWEKKFRYSRRLKSQIYEKKTWKKCLVHYRAEGGGSETNISQIQILKSQKFMRKKLGRMGGGVFAVKVPDCLLVCLFFILQVLNISTTQLSEELEEKWSFLLNHGRMWSSQRISKGFVLIFFFKFICLLNLRNWGGGGLPNLTLWSPRTSKFLPCKFTSFSEYYPLHQWCFFFLNWPWPSKPSYCAHVVDTVKIW